MFRRLALLVSLATCLATSSAFAQQGTSEVRGVVRDQQGAVLPGATVTVRNQDTGMFRETISNADGSYFVSGIVPGRYEVAAQLEGFRPYTQRDLIIQLGKTTTLDIALQVGTLAEAITVTAESPVVDLTSKEVGGNITARELTDLPSINRNYIGFVGLLPGIIPNISTESFGSDSINVNGQDARNNNYMLDGANNNDDVIGQRAGTQARTPLEAIQEFQVLTNQFDAEYGRTTGAIINAVTKQGTNAFRGSAFGYLQDASLTQRTYFAEKNDLEKPDTQYTQFGGTIGGPIVRNRAHFFGSVERVLIDEGVVVNIPARPDLNATTTEATRVWNTLVRFDHQINANHTWGVRWLREHSPQFNQIIDPSNTVAATLEAAREEDDLDQTVVGTLSSVLSNTRVNTLRLAFTQEDVAFANPCFNGNGRNQPACTPQLNYATYALGTNSVAQARVNNAYSIEDTFSWFVPGKRGDHDLKFGVQYQLTTADFNGQDNMNGTFTFPTDTPFDPSNPSTYPERLSIRVPGANNWYLESTTFGVFAQDKWKMNDRLTLSLGLRYDLEDIPIDSQTQDGYGISDAPVDRNNISPRLGFSYDLTGEGRDVLRGGYGLFYDKTHFELITALITSGFFSESFLVPFPRNAADPGPSDGQLPTDPLLSGGPVVNRDLLNQEFQAGARISNSGSIFVDNPDRVIPYTHQVTVGYERQIGVDMSASADYVHALGRDQFMTFDLNPGLRVDTSRTGNIIRTDAGYPTQSIFTRVNAGETDYDAVQVQVEKRFTQGYSWRLAYTLSNSRGNTSGNGIPQSNFQLLDDMRLDLNEGPTDFDRRHNLVLSGQLLVPNTGGLNVSWVARALSGLPFTIQDTSADRDQNGILFDPIDAGSYSGTGDDAYDADNDGGRNGARGPGFFQLDLRLGWRFRAGGQRTLDLSADVFNVTNRANFSNPTGDRRLSSFLLLTGLREGGVPRTLQLGARFSF